MKVFFVGTNRSEDKLLKNYELLYSEIKNLGYSHLSNFTLTATKDFQEQMKEGRDKHIAFYNKMIKDIQTADICIFEASSPSLAVGFLIQRSLDYSKPTIVLYYKDNLVYFLSGTEDEKLIKASYTEDNYKKVLKTALENAREKRDKRFNFFLSPKLLNYIEEASKERGITKSKLLRDMIVNHMRENKEIADEE